MTNASLVVRPATGGGTIVTWASLDDGSSQVYLLAASLDPAWATVPLLADIYNGFIFMILHESVAAAPPAENPILGESDAAMIAALSAHFLSMNQAVANSAALSRAFPPPAPPASGLNHFWRIRANWRSDTDDDGIFDPVEFQLAAAGSAGGGGSAASGNAFNGDTNRDGISDGEQVDSDGDGRADAYDTFPTNGDLAFAKELPPRYALFPISGISERPKSINDRGTVLYTRGVWRGGVWTMLIEEAPVQLDRTYAINDNDVIVGECLYQNGTHHGIVPCCWHSPDSGKLTMSMMNTSRILISREGYDEREFAPILNNSGQFIADLFITPPEETGFEYRGRNLWQLSADMMEVSAAEVEDLLYLGEGGVSWGKSYQDSTGLVFAPNPLPALSSLPANVIRHVLPGSGGASVYFALWPNRDALVLARTGGNWRLDPTFGKAIDLSENGVAIGRTSDLETAPILIGADWQEMERVAPDLPVEWKNGTVTHLDTTPSGWILSQRGNHPDLAYGVSLPIHVEGIPGDPLVPDAPGVDAFSIGKKYKENSTVKERIWIMAPLGGDPKSVVVKTPINNKTPLKISAPNVEFGQGAEELDSDVVLSAAESTMRISAIEGAASGADIPLNLSFGSGESELPSLSRPLGVKIMKERTLRVCVYKVVATKVGQPDNPPDIFPLESVLEEYLNKIFKSQLNLSISVTMDLDPILVNYDSGPTNGYLDTGDAGGPDVTVGHSSEQRKIIAEKNKRPNTGSHIDIYIIGTERPIDNTAAGVTSREDRTCWIIGDEAGSVFNLLAQHRTIAHEIGHVLVDYGHPDNGTGHAPLGGVTGGTDYTRRLMVSGRRKGINPGHLLVKAEWDEAERWLIENGIGDSE